MNRFSLLKRNYDVFEMRLNGLERGANRGAVELFEHLEKPFPVARRRIGVATRPMVLQQRGGAARRAE